MYFIKKPFANSILKHSALILIDIQNDFLELGALSVPNGNEIIPLVNQLQIYFEHIIATKDWHPENHISFLSDTNLKGWPKHCIQNTWGSEFPKNLNITKIKAVFLKGQDKNFDSYSGFYDDSNKKKPTGLLHYLHSNSIDKVFVAGLALDFCVKETITDAHNLKFKSYLITDATRSISSFPELIILKLQKLGILTCLSKDILNNFNLL
ncbi:nicotinamidase (plasmid) [Borrelia miyamotoi]|uniref:nicotinamidase n=3 Tax=Borrelia miyamotoi TaxID=47466 RepID=A0AAQ3CNA8_9SPIR|nr:nicotinamidase [Borrelia miyamotoi]MBW6186237.1 nicotinamidase [Pseudomonas aeruginosa]ATQ15578.1 nicotinamidase [Borrelia miyamotoi]ATQ16544.1 nicotinamidase [Borrelia miyamotoi]ATQ16578.1 nicotinamidase [Borrelia miyamotoi]ATQ16704.1 nicotinamidase [Borrelia miyamotoi]